MARQRKTYKTKTEEQKQREQQALEELKRRMAEMQAEERLKASTVPTAEYLENIRKTHKDPYWMSCQLPTA